MPNPKVFVHEPFVEHVVDGALWPPHLSSQPIVLQIEHSKYSLYCVYYGLISLEDTLDLGGTLS